MAWVLFVKRFAHVALVVLVDRPNGTFLILENLGNLGNLGNSTIYYCILCLSCSNIYFTKIGTSPLLGKELCSLLSTFKGGGVFIKVFRLPLNYCIGLGAFLKLQYLSHFCMDFAHFFRAFVTFETPFTNYQNN